MWTVSTGESTLILVGSIGGAPREVVWRPEALQAAAARADRILTPQEGRASFADVLRVLWRARTLTRLPKGRSTADYLSPDHQVRLEALMASDRDSDWRSRSLLILGFNLMEEWAGHSRRRSGVDAVDVVRRAARRGRTPVRPVGVVRGDEMVDRLLKADPSIHVPCVEAAIEAAEHGPEAARQRAEDWRASRIAEVLASPVDRALHQCWPWGDPDLAPVLHQQWTEALDGALLTPGVTLAVVPVRLLASTGAVLDRLEARGLEVAGPDWKSGGD
jgi:hypothetical protein